MEVSQDSKDGYILIKTILGQEKFIKKLEVLLNIDQQLDPAGGNITKLPHFNDHPLGGNKLLQYTLWVKIAQVLTAKPKRSQERDKTIEILIRDLSNLSNKIGR